MLSWPGFEENALRIERSLAPFFPRVNVIHSLTGVSAFPLPANWIVLPDGSYYGRKFEESLRIANEGHMLHIQADADFEDWQALVRSCEFAFSDIARLGLWAPLVDYTPWSLSRTVLEKRPQQGLNRVSMVDGIVWAISETVLARLRQFSFEGNPLGRGIELAAAAVSKTLSLDVVVDSRLKVCHPRGSGYSEAEAALQLHEFLQQLSPGEKLCLKWIEDFQVLRIAKEKRTLKNAYSQVLKKFLDPIYRQYFGSTNH